MKKQENIDLLNSKLKKHGFGELSIFHTDNNQGRIIYIDRNQPKLISAKDQLLNAELLTTLSYELILEGKYGELKKNIDKSVKFISNTLYNKGYKRPFTMEGYGTVFLPELLNAYFDNFLNNPGVIKSPFTISTYTDFNIKDSSLTKCVFTIGLNYTRGLVIKQIDVMSIGSDFKVVEQWNKPIKTSADIPHKHQVNKKVSAVPNKKEKYRGIK
jgi:hypothetical protein